MAKREHGSNGSGPVRSDEILVQAFARLDPLAFGVALGILAGLLVFAATVLVLAQGREANGLNLILLAQYYPGYRVTIPGAVLGFGYAFLTGLLVGWFTARLRNFALALYLRYVQKKTELSRLNDFLDQV